jgi:xylan 1,4-beta-xylosidase
MYSSYTAASFMRKMDLALQHDVNLEGALTWAFEFEEQPFFAGFRSLATNGINKPVFNVFRMFSMMEGDRLSVISDSEVPLKTILEESVRETPDVTALASISYDKLYIMAWHYHDDDIPGPMANIVFNISDLLYAKGKCKVEKYVIDSKYSNSYAAWKEMGSPQNPDNNQLKRLLDKSNLERVKYRGKAIIIDSSLALNDMLERQGVALYIIELPGRKQ